MVPPLSKAAPYPHLGHFDRGAAFASQALTRRIDHTVYVRKQYHFWPGDHGLDAWDVDRLVELSQNLPVRDVELSSIGEVDTVYWFDEETDTPTVRSVVDHARLIQEADTSYPIILGHDGRVMDGMHRIARAPKDKSDQSSSVRRTRSA